MALNHSRGPILISELSEKERIPKKFLEAILLELRNQGILQSKKGKHGGYFLAKAPAQIFLGKVMRMLEGPLAPLPCLSKTAYAPCDDCLDETVCGIKKVLSSAYEAQFQILEKTTLKDMVDCRNDACGIPVYQI